jgi:hypothetical protein
MSRKKSDDRVVGEVLEALRKKGLGNKQGAVAAARAYLDHVAGKAIPKPQRADSINVTEETARRIADAAARLLSNCPHCGHVLTTAEVTPEEREWARFHPPSTSPKPEPVPPPGPNYPTVLKEGE